MISQDLEVESRRLSMAKRDPELGKGQRESALMGSPRIMDKTNGVSTNGVTSHHGVSTNGGEHFGSAQMGSALMGSLQISCF